MNHLEQLVAEWYEYRGYFVRRNIQVGPRANGGYECELDAVLFILGNNTWFTSSHLWTRTHVQSVNSVMAKSLKPGGNISQRCSTALAYPRILSKLHSLGLPAMRT